MSVAELLSELRKAGVILSVEDGQIRYHAPRGAMTPARRAALASRKDEVLAFLRQPRSYPLSYLQEAIWFEEQLQPGSPVYNMALVWRLEGAMDEGALERALNTVVGRHEALRTFFDVVDGKPLQCVVPEVRLVLSACDLDEGQLAERLKRETCRPFPLGRAPLMRAFLFRLSATTCVLLLNVHHLVADGWSLGILARELSAAYSAFRQGHPAPTLPPLRIQYGEFAARQRGESAGEGPTAWWRDRLAGAPPVLELRTDGIRTPVPGYEGERVSTTLPDPVVRALTGLSRSEEATPFMTLLAAFNLLLQRVTGQDDIVVGTPVINRDAETAELIGLFLNRLALRTDLTGDITFVDLLRRVRETAVGAFRHQDVPFERLVELLRPERNPGYTPLFQVFMNMFSTGEPGRAALEGLKTEVMVLEEVEAISKYDVTLYIRERAGTLHVSLAYRTALFQKARMAELLSQYGFLLEQIAEDPGRRLSDYSLITPAARMILSDPARPLPEPPQEVVTGPIFRRVEEDPDRIAVRQGARAWSYGELWARGAEVAQHLRACGISRGDGVALTAPRCFGRIAGILAVPLSGGVLVPIDPGLPSERKRLILREARVRRLLLVEDENGQREGDWFPADTAVRIDASSGRLLEKAPGTGAEPLLPPPPVSPDDPAYIFFTSGTTGVPKGVLGRHKSLNHFLAWQGEAFGVTADDRSAQLTGLSFDVVLRDVFLPLTRGGTVCLPDVSGDGFDVLGWMARERITLLHAVPTLAHSWLDDAQKGATVPSLRLTFFAGEPLTDTLVSGWRRISPSGEIINLYGPTETTLTKCFFRVPADPPPGVQPLGRPLPDTQLMVMSEEGRMCGIHEPGEIVIRTPFRTFGYINNPEENARRFVRNPFGREESDLLYRTGDRGYIGAGGALRILGRLDDQVKIRGVRVEPGEVSAALAGHPQVQACAVVAHAEGGATPQLAAFVVPRASSGFDAAALRGYLTEMLPSAMVPSIFVEVDRLPYNPNGKIDRKRLPFPGPGTKPREAEFAPPCGALEETIARVWGEVLQVERIGREDTFLDLGGHSLAAMRIISRLRRDYGLSVSFPELMTSMTVARLAARKTRH